MALSEYITTRNRNVINISTAALLIIAGRFSSQHNKKFNFKKQLIRSNSFKLVILIFSLMMEFTFAKYQKGKRGDFCCFYLFT